MTDFSSEVYSVTSNAEAYGGLGGSALGNKVIEIAKKHYSTGSSSQRDAIINKIEALKKEPGISFPLNYRALLES